MPETNRIEHKQQLTKDLGKEVVAFLNIKLLRLKELQAVMQAKMTQVEAEMVIL
jgi:hypothetical protein